MCPAKRNLDPDLSTEGLSQADGNKFRGTWDDKRRNKRVTRAAGGGLNSITDSPKLRDRACSKQETRTRSLFSQNSCSGSSSSCS